MRDLWEDELPPKHLAAQRLAAVIGILATLWLILILTVVGAVTVVRWLL